MPTLTIHEETSEKKYVGAVRGFVSQILRVTRDRERIARVKWTRVAGAQRPHSVSR